MLLFTSLRYSKAMKHLTFFQSENQAMFELDQVKTDMIKLNDQLLEAVQQKLALSEQLEMWQVRLLSILWSLVNKFAKELNLP